MIRYPTASGIGSTLIRVVILLVAICVVLISDTHAENGISCDNPDAQLMFSSVRDHFIQSNGASQARSVAAFLNSGIAAIVIHQPATKDSKPIKVRAFETNGAELNTFQAKYEIPVLSAEPIPDKLVTGYQPSDSTLIQLQIGSSLTHMGKASSSLPAIR